MALPSDVVCSGIVCPTSETSWMLFAETQLVDVEDREALHDAEVHGLAHVRHAGA